MILFLLASAETASSEGSQPFPKVIESEPTQDGNADACGRACPLLCHVLSPYGTHRGYNEVKENATEGKDKLLTRGELACLYLRDAARRQALVSLTASSVRFAVALAPKPRLGPLKGETVKRACFMI